MDFKEKILQYLDKEIKQAEELEEYYWERWKQKKLEIDREIFFEKKGRKEALEDVRSLLKEGKDD